MNKGIQFILSLSIIFTLAFPSKSHPNPLKYDQHGIIDEMLVVDKKLRIHLDNSKNIDDYKFAIVDNEAAAVHAMPLSLEDVQKQELESQKNYYLVVINNNERETIAFDTVEPMIQSVDINYIKENNIYVKATVTVTGTDIVSYTLVNHDETKNQTQENGIFDDIEDSQFYQIVVIDQFGNKSEKEINLSALTTSVVVPNVILSPAQGYAQSFHAEIELVSGYQYAMKKESDRSDLTFADINTFTIIENGTYIFALKNTTTEVIERVIKEINTIDNQGPVFLDPAYTLNNGIITIHATDNLQPDGLTYRMDEGAYQNSSEFTFGDHEEHIFTVKDASGNESEKLVVDLKEPIFLKEPEITKIGTEINGYVKAVTIEIFAEDDPSSNLIKYALQRDGEAEPSADDYGSEAIITVETSGIYYAYIQDKGNNIVKSDAIIIDMIDDVAPTVEVDYQAIFDVHSDYADHQGFRSHIEAIDLQSGIDPQTYACQKIMDTNDINTLLLTLDYQSDNEFILDENGQYIFAVKDFLGNIGYKIIEITKIDTTLPTVSSAQIDYATFITNTLLHCIGFTPYASSKVNVTIPITDDLSGVKKESCLLEVYDQKGQLLKKYSPSRIQGNDYIYTLDITDTLLTLKLSYSDRVHNHAITPVNYINNGEDIQLPILLERDSPIVKEEKIETEIQTIDEKDWISENTLITYTLSDVISPTKTSSGLAKATLSINGQSTDVHIDQTQKTDTLTFSIQTADYKANDDGSFQIVIELADNAGNHSTYHRTIYLDNVLPQLTLTYDNHDADSQYSHIYKENRIANLRIKEMNFDDKLINVVVSENGVEKQPKLKWKLISGQAGTISAEYLTQINFDHNADYQLQISGKDLLGHELDKSVDDKFIVDKLRPTLDISYNNYHTENQNYYAAARTATITIMEHNFDPQRLRILGMATDHGREISYPKISSWQTQGDKHTATLTFAKDAYYTVDFDYQDKAGNHIKTFRKHDFYIDLTAPQIEIDNVSNHSVNAGDIMPIIRLSDTNYDKDGVSIEYSGSRKGKLKFDGSIQTQGDGEVYRFANLKNQKVNDDVYTIHVSLKDKAGHFSSSHISYSVNRFGSTYKMSSSLESLLASKYTANNQDIVFEEINVNQLSSIQVKLGKNGQVETLQPNRDYTVNSSQEKSWYRYTYRLKKNLFESDGIYQIITTSKDAAGHINENTIEGKEASIVFTVDKTKPTIAILDLESNGFYNEKEKKVRLMIEDNIILEKVEVYLNDKLIKTESQNFEFIISIPENKKTQNLRVIAYDKAGNMELKEINELTVSTSLFIYWFFNKPLFIGSIIGACCIVCTGIVYLKKKK